MSSTPIKNALVQRHHALELFEHWAIAVSGLILFLSGMFEMPMAHRYYITSLPGLGWSGDFLVSLNVHYAAAIVFCAVCVFHVVYHALRGETGMLPRKGDMKQSVEVIKTFFGKGEEPPFHKYLPEQRLAYVYMAVVIGLLIISGLIKTWKNLYAPDMNLTLLLWATWTHNITFILFFLGFLAHMAAIILKPNRPMVRGIFTGKVRLDYAEHRHPLWMHEQQGDAPTPPVEQSSETVTNETEMPEESDTLER